VPYDTTGLAFPPCYGQIDNNKAGSVVLFFNFSIFRFGPGLAWKYEKTEVIRGGIKKKRIMLQGD